MHDVRPVPVEVITPGTGVKKVNLHVGARS